MDNDNPVLSRRAFLRLALLAGIGAGVPAVMKPREQQNQVDAYLAKNAQFFFSHEIGRLKNSLPVQAALVAGTVTAIRRPVEEKAFNLPLTFTPMQPELTFQVAPKKNAAKNLTFAPSTPELTFVRPQDLSLQTLPNVIPEGKQNVPVGITRRRLLQIAKTGVKAFGITALIGTVDHFLFGGNIIIKPVERALATASGAMLSQFRKIPVTPVAYDPTKIFPDKPNPSLIPSPKSSTSPLEPQPPTVIPTLPSQTEPTIAPEKKDDVKKLAEKEIGDLNFAEFFLGDLVDMFKKRRLEKAENDASYRERVDPEYLKSDRINFLYLGIDQTRERFNDFTGGAGLGRSDVIMFISFDPHTFKTMAISVPRDLFSPEVREAIADFYERKPGALPLAKINEMTMIPLYNQTIDPYELSRKIFETATGMPVDGVIKTNIDFMQGSEGIPGIFDDLFPKGLEITVPKQIVDPEYPVGYGTKVLVFEPGKQRMGGRRLTEYARTRHADTDFLRSERQRIILQTALKVLLPELINDVAKGDTTTFDKVIQSLNKQKNGSNLFFDINIIEILTTIRDKYQELRSTQKGMAALGVLAANTTDEIADLANNAFISYGPRRDNGLLVDTKPDQPNYAPYQVHLFPSSTKLTPSPLGNHYVYWMPLRLKVKEFLKI